MKILVLTNHSENIAELNKLTAPNKLAYAEAHGYDFENLNLPYSSDSFVGWLGIILEKLTEYDVILTMGCDTIVTNFRIKIEDRISSFYGDHRVSIAKERISWWPINNDVALWPTGTHSFYVLNTLIRDAEIWLKYPWLWQSHLWDLIQADERMTRAVRIVEAREMNSTFQPFLADAQGKTTRMPGPSSWQFGDWILHALDMPLKMRIDVIRAFLPFAGNALYSELPREITGRK